MNIVDIDNYVVHFEKGPIYMLEAQFSAGARYTRGYETPITPEIEEDFKKEANSWASNAL